MHAPLTFHQINASSMRPYLQNLYPLYAVLALIEVPLLIGCDIPIVLLVAEVAILAVLLLSYCRKRESIDCDSLLSIFADRRLFYFFLGYMAFFWPALAIIKYYSLKFYLFDTGVFANIIAQLVNTGRFYSTVLEQNALADHFCPNLILFYPLFHWKMTFLWLTWVKILAFLASALLLIRLGRLIIGPDSMAVYIVPVLFLFNKLLSNTLYFEFQPSSLSLPFILLGFIYAIEKKYIRMALALIFMVGFKEHLPLVWVSLGIFLLLYRKQKNFGISLVLMGVVVGLLIFFVVMPHFNGDMPTRQIEKFGPFSMIPEKLGMLVLAFTTVGFLPLFSPKTLLFVLPAFAMSLISNVPSMLSIDYHYLDMPAVILFIGVLCGIADLKKSSYWLGRLHPRAPACVLSLVFLLIIASNTYFPALGVREHWPENKHSEMHDEVRLLKTLVDGCNLWTVENVGILCFEYSHLKSINEREGWVRAMNDPACHWLVLAASYANSSLKKDQYALLKSWILKREAAGDYQRLSGFTHFMVFRATHPIKGLGTIPEGKRLTGG